MPYGVWLLRPDAGRETVLCGTEEARRVRDPSASSRTRPMRMGPSLAEIAVINELGSSDTPARPFMRQSFENHEAELQAACDRANAILSNGGTAEQALNQLGVFCRGLVQEEIVEGGFAPNAESTIKKKGSDQPLIDTGYMRQSVNYVVKRRGG